MSWFIGYIGKTNINLRNVLSPFNPFFKFESENIKIYGGGLKENLIFETADSSGWIISGLGIKAAEDSYKFLEENDWNEILSQNTPDLTKVNGHFVGIKWNNSKIFFFNDVIGIRELYIYKEKLATFFLTRLDLLSLIKNDLQVDFTELSTNWLLSFQLSNSSLIKKVKRLGPGGKGWCNEHNIEITNSGWQPQTVNNDSSKEKFIFQLKKITTFIIENKRNLSLGMSGGLDSRVLLEFLLSDKSKNWIMHSFGDPAHPDVKLAKQISADKKIKHYIINETLSSPDILLKNLKYYIGQLGLIIPASETIIYPYHNFLFEKGYTIIDGGMGEIHRREFLYKLLILGKSSIKKKKLNKLYSLFSQSKAPIFSKEIEDLLYKQAIIKIENLLKEHPDYKHLGLENWLDYLIIKYKTPNIAGPSQSLLDNLSVAYMPYIQPALLDISFNLEITQKKNGRIYREIINTGANHLNNYPLVKNGIYYPYNSNSFLLRLILEYKQKRTHHFYDNSNSIFINHLKDYILDSISSQDFINYSYYNHYEIKKWINNYYFYGEKKYLKKINWWLTFDIWRKTLLIK